MGPQYQSESGDTDPQSDRRTQSARQVGQDIAEYAHQPCSDEKIRVEQGIQVRRIQGDIGQELHNDASIEGFARPDPFFPE